jgi:hypothetical protein
MLAEVMLLVSSYSCQSHSSLNTSPGSLELDDSDGDSEWLIACSVVYRSSAINDSRLITADLRPTS